MNLTVEDVGGVGVVSLPIEELDASSSADFKRDMAGVIDTRAKLALDLSSLRFVDSSGLGAFLSCLRKLKAKGGDLKLFGMSTSVRAVFELVRMHRVFDIYATRADALAAFATLGGTDANRPGERPREARRRLHRPTRASLDRKAVAGALPA
jgi:anti-sigma B factor antagonist